MTAVDNVTISKKRYRKLVEAERKLSALEDAGVDNWEWYGDAMQSIYGDED